MNRLAVVVFCLLNGFNVLWKLVQSNKIITKGLKSMNSTPHTHTHTYTHPQPTQPGYFNIDRSKTAFLLWFLNVTCSCCPYLYFGSPIMWVTYLGSWMTDYLSGLPRVPFLNCCQCMYLVISLLVLRAGYEIWLYQFLIIAYLFTCYM